MHHGFVYTFWEGLDALPEVIRHIETYDVTTIRAAIAQDATPAALNRPGHIFPLKARDGGVLERPGHTEAAVDLTALAGLKPCGVLCETPPR